MRQFGTHKGFKTKVKQDSECSHLTHALSVRLMEYTWKVSVRELQGNGKLRHTNQRTHKILDQSSQSQWKFPGAFNQVSFRTRWRRGILLAPELTGTSKLGPTGYLVLHFGYVAYVVLLNGTWLPASRARLC